MNKVSTMLLAIDGEYDDRALLNDVEPVALRNHSRITVLSIMEPPNGDPDKDVAVSNLLEWATKIRSDYIDDLVASLSKNGIPVEVEHAVGKSHLEIIRRTLDGKYDLVMKPATQETGLERLLIGGTDVQLLSLCPVPVWIFQPTVSRALKKIAVAVDLQPDDRERTVLAESVLSWGKNIAEPISAELHIIHAWSLYREATLRGRSALSHTVDKLVDGQERLHRKWLHRALQQVGLGDGNIHEHLVKGEAKQLIPKIVDELNIDLLIMGTVGRTGIPGFFIGNTADTVLRKVGCSVLAIKPDDFSTPVEAAASNIPTR